MTDLRNQQQRVQQLGRRATWFTGLSVTVPTALLTGGAVLGGVTLSSPGHPDPAVVCVAGLLVVGSAFTFLLLREQAQNSLGEAALIRRLVAANLAPTNGGQPAQVVRETYRKVEQPWAPARTSPAGGVDLELTALLAAAAAGTDIPQSSSSDHGHGSGGDSSWSHQSATDHGSSHSHGISDHGASHVHVDVSSF